MWYRIELNKDRSVRTCVEVSGSLNEGRSIHYIEADSKASAIALLAARWQKQMSRQRVYADNRNKELDSKGLCRRCKKRKGSTGTESLCRVCADAQNTRLALVKKGVIKPRWRRARTDAERAKLAAASAAKDRATKAIKRLKNPGAEHALAERRRYTKILEAFESMTPSRFRGWLVAKIAECQDKIDGKKTIAEHLQAAE